MTLVEVVVAIALFAAVALPLFGMFSNSIKMERRALVDSLATYTAQMKMEEIYGMTEAQLLALDGYRNDTDIVISVDEVDGQNIEDAIYLFYEYATTLMPDTEGHNLNLVRVEVSVWNETFEVEAVLENLVRPVPENPGP